MKHKAKTEAAIEWFVGEIYSLIDIRAEAGPNSENSDLQLDWELISADEGKLQIKLKFENPKSVKASDKLIVKLNVSKFANLKDNMLKTSLTKYRNKVAKVTTTAIEGAKLTATAAVLVSSIIKLTIRGALN